MAHVFTLEATDHLVPRWYSEGISVYEEWSTGPLPGRQIPLHVIEMMQRDRFLPIADLDGGFIRPSYPNQVIVSYMQAGLACDVPDSGCCGMAGSFGYESAHYDVGLACGERVLLPAVRAAARDDLIVADGFSCREMIRQETGRRALHLAEVLRMGLREDAAPSEEVGGAEDAARGMPVGALAAAGFLGASIGWRLARSRARDER